MVLHDRLHCTSAVILRPGPPATTRKSPPPSQVDVCVCSVFKAGENTGTNSNLFHKVVRKVIRRVRVTRSSSWKLKRLVAEISVETLVDYTHTKKEKKKRKKPVATIRDILKYL